MPTRVVKQLSVPINEAMQRCKSLMLLVFRLFRYLSLYRCLLERAIRLVVLTYHVNNLNCPPETTNNAGAWRYSTAHTLLYYLMNQTLLQDFW